MAWVKIELLDVAAKVSQEEIDSFRQDAGFNAETGETPDPVLGLIRQVTGRVRSYCRNKDGTVRLSPDKATIPFECVDAATDVIVYNIIKRMPIDQLMTDPRKNAYDKSIEYLKQIARGEVIVESYSEEETEDEGNIYAVPLTAMDFTPHILD